MLFSDLYCPPVPQVEFATPDNKKSLVGEIVNYRCIQNYRFPDGSSYKTTTCLESKKWSPVLPDCICKYDNKEWYQNYFTPTREQTFSLHYITGCMQSHEKHQHFNAFKVSLHLPQHKPTSFKQVCRHLEIAV